MFFLILEDGVYKVDYLPDFGGYGMYETNDAAQVNADFLNEQDFPKVNNTPPAPRKDKMTQDERNKSNKGTFRNYKMKGK